VSPCSEHNQEEDENAPSAIIGFELSNVQIAK